MGQPVLHGLTSEFAHGRAFSEVVPLVNPAAGAGFTYTVGGNYWERLAALSFVFTTNGNAANRAVTLRIKDGSGATLVAVPGAAVQVASTAYTYSFWGDQTPTNDTVNLVNAQPVPRIYLQPAYSVAVAVGAIDAGDQVSAIRLYVERFDTGPEGYPVGMVEENMYVGEYERLGN